jgi:ABC-type glycerol-3-phosphate transport system permease component
LGRVVIYGALLAGSLVMLFPFLWMVGTSLKVDRALFVTPPQLLPIPFAPENYRIVLDTFPVGRFLVNSVVVATASTVLQLTTSAMAAYAFARLRFWGRDVLFVLYLATLMIPFQVTIVPLFVEMRLLGFVNSYPGLILPTVASAFGTFLLRQAFLGLPHELEEAAFIDGANHWTVFSRIVIPLSRPVLAELEQLPLAAGGGQFPGPDDAPPGARQPPRPLHHGLEPGHGRRHHQRDSHPGRLRGGPETGHSQCGLIRDQRMTGYAIGRR